MVLGPAVRQHVRAEAHARTGLLAYGWEAKERKEETDIPQFPLRACPPMTRDLPVNRSYFLFLPTSHSAELGQAFNTWVFEDSSDPN